MTNNVMDEATAIERVRDYALLKYPDYPTHSLMAKSFEAGWVVFPESDPTDLDSLRIGQAKFVIGRNSEIMESPWSSETKWSRAVSGPTHRPSPTRSAFAVGPVEAEHRQP